jgi:stage IV sporulation protein FB
MIEISLGKLKIAWHFSFFAAVSLAILFAREKYVLWGLYACLLHEAGHFAAMTIKKQPVKRLVFYGAGIKIVTGSYEAAVPFEIRVWVLAAGCVVNFIIYALSAIISVFYGGNGGLALFGVINLSVGLFNMLPLQGFDGGKLIVSALYRLCPYERAFFLEKFLKKSNIFLIITTAVIFAVCGYRNLTLYLTFLYLLFSALAI